MKREKKIFCSEEKQQIEVKQSFNSVFQMFRQQCTSDEFVIPAFGSKRNKYRSEKKNELDFNWITFWQENGTTEGE